MRSTTSRVTLGGMDRQAGAVWGRALAVLLLIVAAVATAGCTGKARDDPPPSPSFGVRADVVSMPTSWVEQPCRHAFVTLRSGDVLDLQYAPSFDEGNCHAADMTPTLGGEAVETLLRTSSKELRWPEPGASLGLYDYPAPLVLAGGSDDGQPWIVVLNQRQPAGCWRLYFGGLDPGDSSREIPSTPPPA